jgi:hypothetical protein
MNFLNSIKSKYSDENNYPFKKWLLYAFLIKLVLFIFYGICFHLYPETSIGKGLLYVEGGDTFTYYTPLINFCNEGTYGNACRMPGLAVVFMPIYWLTKSASFAYNFVIIFQFLLSTISVYFLGLIAYLLFESKLIFIFVVILYSLFYHIGDHILMADSQANSTLIIAVYFFVRSYKNNFSLKYIIFSGAFFCWSIFSRLIAIMPFLVLFLLLIYFLLWKKRDVMMTMKVVFFYISIFGICETAWIIRNKISLNKFIVFTVPECYSSYSYNWLEYAKIPASWGYETTPWWNEINWFLDVNKNEDSFEYPKSVLTSNYTIDSLVNIKREYFYLKSLDQGIYEPTIGFKNRVNNYLSEYKKNHSINYYLINPLKLAWKFHFKKNIVDLPFPKKEKMNVFLKFIKVVNWALISFLNLGILFFAPILLIFKKNIETLLIVTIPFSITFFLSYLFGAIEQRYIWPVLPFAIIINCVFINLVIERIKLTRK